ncbi:hypothetical protein Nos7524_4102 [Nostoc sp. PCC 7524]|uniref:carboxypeptidase regulatory-like domain-containing protein n=1 Tax=Nostoc sp. (strain ATCC 29411 / PCC 7524) TaxID=28072 RepID=UPI00029F0306|nr:carboxypeptidase regulatory-like domain-containing protein [Nostoc sp. PCC 7524]AFY49872.1 hypothetical protein Nos7524_4102 [Nostoc sp. PCC 7524]
MFYQPSTPPPPATILQSENPSCTTPVTARVNQDNQLIAGTIATPTKPESLPPEFSLDDSQSSCVQTTLNEDVENQNIIANGTTNSDNNIENAIDSGNQLQSSQVLAQSDTTSLTAEDAANSNTENIHVDINHTAADQQQPQSDNNLVAQESKTSIDKNNSSPDIPVDNIIANAKSLLVAVFINAREVGSLEIIPEGNTLLLPLEDFSKIAGLEVENIDTKIQLKTPLGVVTLTEADFKKIDGIIYVSDIFLKEKLLTNLELKPSDLALNVDLPWRRGINRSRNQALDLEPEVKAPSNGLSNLRQELRYFSNAGRTSWRSSTLLGGRLAGGAWRLRLENNFVDQPQLTEYFFFKRSGRMLYQLGRQQIALHPLFTGTNFTGAQIGYTNIPADNFTTSYSASELLPRRSRPLQSFRGVVPPASIVQLRVSGFIVAQQQVGLTGEYEFVDINLPTGQSNEIELLVFDRNNLSIPIEIRSLRLNASDLLLPAGGNIQIAGVGLTGNWIQNNLFDDFTSTEAGRFTGFYQVRQGLSDNFTVESAVQLLPETTQAHAGFAWRLADPVILSANVGTSRGEVGYAANLDIKFDSWQILGTSEYYPDGYFYSRQSLDRQNHSLDIRYKFSNNLDLGVIARSFRNQNDSTSYILPTFAFRPAANLSLRGSPDYFGRYSLNAFYRPTDKTRLSFTSFGDIYTTDFGYNFNREYLLSFGTESGGDLPTRFTLVLNRNALNLFGLSWRLGLGYRDGEIGPVVGASMRIIPGLFASIDYQGIPSRNRNIFGNNIGDDRLTISLISDLSFAGGSVRPSEYSSLNKDRGAIAGRIVVEGGRNGTDLSGGLIQVYNNRGRSVGGARIDSQGNFFVGNLREGNYIVQIDPDELPIEVSLRKTTIVAEVAGAAVTKLDFPVRLEYGMAGRITDVSGQPMSEVEVEVVDTEGKRVATAMTDQFGLYRIDGLPVGKYTLRVPQQANITNTATLPQLEVAISQDFIYDQNLRLPISAAVKQIQE